jgi:hypothetical protein
MNAQRIRWIARVVGLLGILLVFWMLHLFYKQLQMIQRHRETKPKPRIIYQFDPPPGWTPDTPPQAPARNTDRPKASSKPTGPDVPSAEEEEPQEEPLEEGGREATGDEKG